VRDFTHRYAAPQTPKARNTFGNSSGKSSAISPGPKLRAHSTCSQAPVQAASKGEPARQKPGDEPRQHIARPRRRQPRRRTVIVGGVDRTAARGVGDHRVGAFVQHHAARPLRRLPRRIDLGIGGAFGGGGRELLGNVGEEARELPGMGGQDAPVVQGGEEVGVLGEDGEGVGVEDQFEWGVPV
jgi:hypothetical protein